MLSMTWYRSAVDAKPLESKLMKNSLSRFGALIAMWFVIAFFNLLKASFDSFVSVICVLLVFCLDCSWRGKTRFQKL